ncbi:MAG: conjugative transposon protein TraN [Sphingobacterium sp.]
MKRINYLSLLFFGALLTQQGTAQEMIVKQREVPAHDIELSSNKTSNLIFPYGIISVDRGDQAIMVQQAKGVDNVLQVKAASQGLEASNLTVITSDRQLYTFNVQYAERPRQLNFTMKPIVRPEEKNTIHGGTPTQGTLEALASDMLASLESSVKLKRHKMAMHFQLDGIFVDGGRIFFRIHLINKSDLGYQVGQFRTFLLDKKQLKRTAIQEKEFTPQWLAGNLDFVPPRSRRSFLFVLPQFTIPDKKHLIIQLMEENGARNFSLKMGNSHLQKATPIY